MDTSVFGGDVLSTLADCYCRRDQRVPRREPAAVEQIDEARGEPAPIDATADQVAARPSPPAGLYTSATDPSPTECAHEWWTERCRSCAARAVEDGAWFARSWSTKQALDATVLPRTAAGRLRAMAEMAEIASTDDVPEDALTLLGPELAAYRRLQTAARLAHQAQQDMTRTGGELRDAIAGLCAAMQPGMR